MNPLSKFIYIAQRSPLIKPLEEKDFISILIPDGLSHEMIMNLTSRFGKFTVVHFSKTEATKWRQKIHRNYCNDTLRN